MKQVQSKRRKQRPGGRRTKPTIHIEAKHPAPTLPPTFEALAHILARIERRIHVQAQPIKRMTRR